MKINIRLIALTVVFSILSTGIFAQKDLPEMVFIEAGKFKMGSENGDNDESPVHEVAVDDFYISKYEITVAQYRTFCKATGWKMPEPPEWGWKDNHPIVNVSWKDAGAYTLWLARETGKSYRLPTEEEWEYAARGGNKSKGYLYAGSNNPDQAVWYYETTYGSSTQPVGLKKANELDLYDMSGNVWEWCKDGYTLQYYSSGSKNSSKGPTGENYRVLRGGAWNSSAFHTRVANRDRNDPESSNVKIGFRVAYQK